MEKDVKIDYGPKTCDIVDLLFTHIRNENAFKVEGFLKTFGIKQEEIHTEDKIRQEIENVLEEWKQVYDYDALLDKLFETLCENNLNAVVDILAAKLAHIRVEDSNGKIKIDDKIFPIPGFMYRYLTERELAELERKEVIELLDHSPRTLEEPYISRYVVYGEFTQPFPEDRFYLIIDQEEESTVKFENTFKAWVFVIDSENYCEEYHRLTELHNSKVCMLAHASNVFQEVIHESKLFERSDKLLIVKSHPSSGISMFLKHFRSYTTVCYFSATEIHGQLDIKHSIVCKLFDSEFKKLISKHLFEHIEVTVVIDHVDRFIDVKNIVNEMLKCSNVRVVIVCSEIQDLENVTTVRLLDFSETCISRLIQSQWEIVVLKSEIERIINYYKGVLGFGNPYTWVCVANLYKNQVTQVREPMKERNDFALNVSVTDIYEKYLELRYLGYLHDCRKCISEFDYKIAHMIAGLKYRLDTEFETLMTSYNDIHEGLMKSALQVCKFDRFFTDYLVDLFTFNVLVGKVSVSSPTDFGEFFKRRFVQTSSDNSYLQELLGTTVDDVFFDFPIDQFDVIELTCGADVQPNVLRVLFDRFCREKNKDLLKQFIDEHEEVNFDVARILKIPCYNVVEYSLANTLLYVSVFFGFWKLYNFIVLNYKNLCVKNIYIRHQNSFHTLFHLVMYQSSQNDRRTIKEKKLIINHLIDQDSDIIQSRDYIGNTAVLEKNISFELLEYLNTRGSFIKQLNYHGFTLLRTNEDSDFAMKIEKTYKTDFYALVNRLDRTHKRPPWFEFLNHPSISSKILQYIDFNTCTFEEIMWSCNFALFKCAFRAKLACHRTLFITLYELVKEPKFIHNLYEWNRTEKINLPCALDVPRNAMQICTSLLVSMDVCENEVAMAMCSSPLTKLSDAFKSVYRTDENLDISRLVESLHGNDYARYLVAMYVRKGLVENNNSNEFQRLMFEQIFVIEGIGFKHATLCCLIDELIDEMVDTVDFIVVDLFDYVFCSNESPFIVACRNGLRNIAKLFVKCFKAKWIDTTCMNDFEIYCFFVGLRRVCGNVRSTVFNTLKSEKYEVREHVAGEVLEAGDFELFRDFVEKLLYNVNPGICSKLLDNSMFDRKNVIEKKILLIDYLVTELGFRFDDVVLLLPRVHYKLVTHMIENKYVDVHVTDEYGNNVLNICIENLERYSEYLGENIYDENFRYHNQIIYLADKVNINDRANRQIDEIIKNMKKWRTIKTEDFNNLRRPRKSVTISANREIANNTKMKISSDIVEAVTISANYYVNRWVEVPHSNVKEFRPTCEFVYVIFGGSDESFPFKSDYFINEQEIKTTSVIESQVFVIGSYTSYDSACEKIKNILKLSEQKDFRLLKFSPQTEEIMLLIRDIEFVTHMRDKIVVISGDGTTSFLLNLSCSRTSGTHVIYTTALKFVRVGEENENTLECLVEGLRLSKFEKEIMKRSNILLLIDGLDEIQSESRELLIKRMFELLTLDNVRLAASVRDEFSLEQIKEIFVNAKFCVLAELSENDRVSIVCSHLNMHSNVLVNDDVRKEVTKAVLAVGEYISVSTRICRLLGDICAENISAGLNHDYVIETYTRLYDLNFLADYKTSGEITRAYVKFAIEETNPSFAKCFSTALTTKLSVSLGQHGLSSQTPPSFVDVRIAEYFMDWWVYQVITGEIAIDPHLYDSLDEFVYKTYMSGVTPRLLYKFLEFYRKPITHKFRFSNFVHCVHKHVNKVIMDSSQKNDRNIIKRKKYIIEFVCEIYRPILLNLNAERGNALLCCTVNFELYNFLCKKMGVKLTNKNFKNESILHTNYLNLDFMNELIREYPAQFYELINLADRRNEFVWSRCLVLIRLTIEMLRKIDFCAVKVLSIPQDTHEDVKKAILRSRICVLSRDQRSSKELLESGIISKDVYYHMLEKQTLVGSFQACGYKENLGQEHLKFTEYFDLSTEETSYEVATGIRNYLKLNRKSDRNRVHEYLILTVLQTNGISFRNTICCALLNELISGFVDLIDFELSPDLVSRMCVNDSPFIIAIKTSHVNIARLLWKSFDIGWFTCLSEFELTCVFKALERYFGDLLKPIFDRLSNLSLQIPKRTVVDALESGNLNLLKANMSMSSFRASDVHAYENRKFGLLHYILESSQFDCESVLQRKKKMITYIVKEIPSELEFVDARGRTPLLCERVDFELTKHMIERGANVNVEDQKGYTIMHILIANFKSSGDSWKPYTYNTHFDYLVKVLKEKGFKVSNLKKLKIEETLTNSQVVELEFLGFPVNIE